MLYINVLLLFLDNYIFHTHILLVCNLFHINLLLRFIRYYCMFFCGRYRRFRNFCFFLGTFSGSIRIICLTYRIFFFRYSIIRFHLFCLVVGFGIFLRFLSFCTLFCRLFNGFLLLDRPTLFGMLFGCQVCRRDNSIGSSRQFVCLFRFFRLFLLSLCLFFDGFFGLLCRWFFFHTERSERLAFEPFLYEFIGFFFQCLIRTKFFKKQVLLILCKLYVRVLLYRLSFFIQKFGCGTNTYIQFLYYLS